MARPEIHTVLVPKTTTVRSDIYQQGGYPLYGIPRGPEYSVPDSPIERATSYNVLYKDPSTTTGPIRRGIYITPTDYIAYRSRLNYQPGVTFFRTPIIDDAQLHRIGIDFAGGGFWDDFPGGWVPPANPSWLEDSAIQKALAKLQAQNVHLGNFLAELDQTCELYHETARLIATTVNIWRGNHSYKEWRKVVDSEVGNQKRSWSQARKDEYRRRRQRRQARAAYNEIPSSWLQVQYGWNPLMSDLNSACQGLDQAGGVIPPQFDVRGVRTSQDFFELSRGGQFGSSQRLGVKARYITDVNLTYQMGTPLAALFSSLGLINPLEILWEKLPYSFVVDWFLPVGSWLQSLTADTGYVFQHGYCRRKCEFSSNGIMFEQILDPSGAILGSGKWTGSVGGEATIAGFHYQRTRYHSSPVPGLHFKNPFSAGHIANGLSLLTQAFR